MLREKLKQKGQDDFLFSDHHVAKTGLGGLTPHLGLRKHAYASFLSALPPA
jgi:hypothetical protein